MLWAETLPEYLPKPRGILWLADPTDIANRREVAHFEHQIDEAALSPDGQWVAVIARQEEPQGGGPLWVVNLDGTGLRLLAPTRAWQILWSPDSQAVFYNVWGEEESSIERVNVSSGEWQQVRAVPSSAGFVSLLGWSADGSRLYHFYQSSDSQYEIWAVAADGQDAQVCISLARDPGVPVLSPDSSKFLIGTAQGLSWISPDGAEQQVIITQTSRGFSAVWSPDSRDLVVSQWQRGQPSVAIQAIDVQNRSTRKLAEIPLDEWRLLALSPDSQWLAAERIYDGPYWVHLPTQTVIPSGGQERRLFTFVAWVRKAAP